MEDTTETPSKGQSRCRTSRKSNLPCRGCSNCNSSWLLVVYGFFAIAFTNGCFRAITIFMPDFIVEFESSATLMGWIFSIDPFMLGVMTPFVAYSTSKFGTRPVVMVSGAFAASGVMLFSQARHISLAGIAIGVVTSATQATVFASSVLLIRRNFRLHYALAHGVVISGYSCGLFVFPPILEALSIAFSWRGTCLIASGFMFNTVLMGALMKPPRRTRECYAPIEAEVKPSEQHVEGSKSDGEKRSYISLNNHEPSAGTDLEYNGTVNLQANPEEGAVDRIDSSSLCTSTENCNTVDHKVNFPDVIQSGTLSSSETHQIEISDGINKNDATTTVESALDHHSHKSLDLDDRPSKAAECNTDKITMSGVGLGQRSGCLDTIVARNYHTFAIYTLSMFSTTVGYSIFLLHVSTSFKEFGVGLKDVATGLSVFAAFNLIGRLSNGLFVARGIPPAYLIVLAEILAFVSITAVYLCKLFPLRATATAMYGIGTGVYTTLFYVFHREIVDPKVDVKTLSIFMFIEGLAGPAGGSLGGLLRDVTGNYRLTYMISAGLSFFAAVLMVVVIFLERRRKRSSEIVKDADV
ncbi:uncharacterized protein LOC591388 isoform X1 [Strongylocentrotus purpuratus]|uniref:Uncharacterized protein n=1 Tax=Strongylocentrotus purpuratus TaxID=7668 RepID=A0A7M7LWP4_STRPU|nr:uncharacterized protein LOC591388 isoform X1 [Strongylocentrotus purpuratus]